MKRTADVIVVGLGAHGSAAFYQLAKRGVDVIGIDQYSPPHNYGSSHGESRITRLACGEGAEYTNFARRSIEIWKELEEQMERRGKLYKKTGGLMIGTRARDKAFHGRRDFVGRSVKIAEQYGIPHDLLSADEIRKRFPQFRVGDDEYAYYELDAGILFPETCIEANYLSALEMGAIFLGAKVGNVRQVGDDVIVTTSAGEITAKRCIISAGAFVQDFLPSKYWKLFKITRQAMHWFSARAKHASFEAKNGFPVYIWERQGIYGFPGLGNDGMKVAHGKKGVEIYPADISLKRPHPMETHEMQRLLHQAIPDLAGSATKSLVCMYTNTPDDDFVNDTHPEMPNVMVVSACSGHGFKHSAAIGEAVAQSVMGEKSEYDLTPFSFGRFKNIL